MKHIIFFLFISTSVFAQTPRLKFRQIQKDTTQGSIAISNPADSQLVFSRDFYISYGVDTVLILYGDTLGGVGGGFASILSDGVTVLGDGTTGNELKVDTATVISTIQGLIDSLANYVTLDGTETITGAKTFTSDLNVDAKIALNAGDNNIVIGDGAGASLVSGQGIRNVLIATESGRLINSGDDNVANGYRVLYNATSATHNIGVGSYALYLNESGSYNIANGGLSLYSNTTGFGNIANGFYALHNNLTGSYNIGNAYESLYSNTSGSFNIGSGYRALYSLSSGSNNQAYGYEAGRYINDGSNLTTANGSLFIGSNTRASADGNSNEIVIGTNAIGNGSNSVTIGNDGTIGTPTTKTILNGNVGIGTSTPISRLEVAGSNAGIRINATGLFAQLFYYNGANLLWNAYADITTSSYRIGNSLGTQLTLTSAGNLGIGTTSPSYKVTADGYGNAFMYAALSNSIGTVGNWVGYLYGYTGNSYQKGATIFESIDGNGRGKFHIALNNAANSSIVTISDAKLTVLPSGEVGIGETNPNYKLDVNGKVKIQDLTGTGGNAVYENGGVLGVASDARFKTYVGDIQNGIALINQLKPKYFIDNRNSSFQQLGFYAQEVKSVINEASYPIGNTDYLGINDRAILATTVKAIQEQQAIIETQQQTITDLQTTIQSLITRIENLENK